MKSFGLVVLAAFFTLCQAQFQVLDAESIANSTAVKFSDACLTALQGTVNCNSTLVNIAAADDVYGINNDTYAYLCTNSCCSSLEIYHNTVSSACAGQDEAWSGYPATYFGDVYWASYNLSCLADPTSGAHALSYQLLQKTPYSYYDSEMASDWSSMQSLCHVTYPTDVPKNPTNVTDIAGFAPANYTSPSCLSEATYTVVSGDNCIAISQAQNVSTGTLISLNNLLPDCSNLDGNPTQPPSARPHMSLQISGDTCESICNEAGITFVQLTSWNPTINSYCSNPIAGQAVCVGQAGSTWTGTTIPGASATQNGVYATTTVAAPSNLAYGTTTNCGQYYVVQSGDDCSLVALNNTITVSLFEAINPSINAGCTNLVPGLAYCVRPVANWNSTNTTTTTTASYVTAPAPTPSGTTFDCYKWHVIISGDYCALLESEYGITFTQLQSWNSNLNSTCGNLILGDAYCVDGPSNVSSTSRIASATAISTALNL
ncbi:carbohydrate-binding module family 50 protein [Aspergillus luchuensis CBS 106.47]|uniref:Carbohydrate-binding module family 50 protein n=1 Tax=Aspergillus luchuensis (strain CBS 106.47) TaxID=1137211 RepID=A0A1M3TMN9_ASPLC|nr:carbohydrate-binding module family 50 protein [Aspergillus luchuensis CBS 106.47]GAA91092.1 LysM domain protein [Aspergillus luchuensis IFO 4308]